MWMGVNNYRYCQQICCDRGLNLWHICENPWRMILPAVFSFTDILWLVADDIAIETAGGNGDRHVQTNYWTEGDFLPGWPQLAHWCGWARWRYISLLLPSRWFRYPLWSPRSTVDPGTVAARHCHAHPAAAFGSPFLLALKFWVCCRFRYSIWNAELRVWVVLCRLAFGDIHRTGVVLKLAAKNEK